MKIPFDIKFRPQIESGEYKVILDCGEEVEILAWDKSGKYPIVCMVKKEEAIPFRTDNNGIAYHYPEGWNYSDLFIITPEPELSEFEDKVKQLMGCYPNATRENKGSLIYEARKKAAELLELAKNEIYSHESLVEYAKKATEEGKAEALKDLPRWRKWENGACGNGLGIPLAIVKRGLNGYELVDALGIRGEQYIMLSDLEKLPGFNE